MSDKERLIKLLADLRFLGGCERQIADHLVKNGVTFAKDLRRKMMEDATSYKTPCAHPVEQVQKTYYPQEGVYECYCHNCGERWWVEKHE